MSTAISKLTMFRPTAATVRRSLAIAGAFAALAVTTASVAAPANTDVPSVVVRYDDLDLTAPAGVNALYRRISVAAQQVCPDVHSRDLSVVVAGEKCRADAIGRAVTEVNNPQLALLHSAHVSHG